MTRFRFQTTRNGSCIGAIEVPTAVPGTVIAACVGDDKADALAKAAALAERIAADPVMSAMMPPEAMPAIKAAKLLAGAAKRGSRTLRAVWRSLRGPGKRRLAKVLHTEAVKQETGWYPGDPEHRRPVYPGVDGGDWIPDYARGQVTVVDPDGEEVGVVPFALLAAKYGPAAAKKAAALYRARKAKKAAAKKRKAAAAKARAREAEPPEPEEPDDDQGDDDQGDDDEGGAE